MSKTQVHPVSPDFRDNDIEQLRTWDTHRVALANSKDVPGLEKLSSEIGINNPIPFASALAWMVKGHANYILGNYKEAIGCYDQSIALNFEDADIYFHKGNALCYFGKCEEAILCYSRVLVENPGRNEVRNNLGTALGWLGRYEEALANYDKVIMETPNDAHVYNNKGAALESLELYPQDLKPLS